MFVKICGLREQRHVRDAVEAGADAVGFVFADSVRRVTPQEAAVVSADVPASVKRVAVMLHPTNEEWQEVLAGFAPDVLQTDAEDFAALDVPDTVERWPVHRQENKVTDTFRAGIKVSVTLTPTYVYEGAKSGVGAAVDWTTAAEVARRGNMILAGGLSAENVAEAIAIVRPFGVDVSSAVESSRGVKDSQKIRDFIRAAKAAGKEV